MIEGLTTEQREALEHLRLSYAGPEEGPTEFLRDRPDLRYIVGHLFPKEVAVADAAADAEAIEPEGEGLEGTADLRPEEWRPSSLAVSFVTDADEVHVSLRAGTYSPEGDEESKGWRRTPWLRERMALSPEQPTQQLDIHGIEAAVTTVWRPHGGARLVTVSVRNLAELPAEGHEFVSRMLFQVELEVGLDDGSFHEYVRLADRIRDPETDELALRYRGRRVFAIGHGVAADWTMEGERCVSIRSEFVPARLVPSIRTKAIDPGDPAAAALKLERLAKIAHDQDGVCRDLARFVESFELWLAQRLPEISDLHERHQAAGKRIALRAERAAARMREGIAALDDPTNAAAFGLAMTAMRLQMQRSIALREPEKSDAEPEWRPFQLGFLLAALASTVNKEHEDRDLVDLIWFPTGGGKTEAYLGLAATEIFRRRLVGGVAGGGTAVLTRYTMRLLTAQQFQRTALLICAMELLRRDPTSVASRMAPFTLGLWVGNETTPSTRADASKKLADLYQVDAPREQNPFQVEACPWCGTAMLPLKKSHDHADYGPRHHAGGVRIGCASVTCDFAAGLPMSVVDEEIYDEPPTFLLATVDKLARLQFVERASRVLGIGTAYEQPSLMIQDELHLLSGPLGTTVGVFEASILAMLELRGSRPKIVASTATIRAAEEQVAGLYGRPVALYPPAWIDEESSFFSEVERGAGGRLYVGLMPVSLPQATSLISTFAPLVELPAEVGRPGVPYDPFWTLVAYHNSLRELGRSSNYLLDDVGARLEARARRRGRSARRIDADGLIELTGRQQPGELARDLRRLELPNDGDQAKAADAVVSSNMLSVGIDVQRLGLMLMAGQPKTTSEYIQATSRVGRGQARGLVVTLFRSNRARDRSHFETFRPYHEAFYRAVEPTSVTPWALNSRNRTLAGAFVMLLRHSVPQLRPDTAAGEFNLDVKGINAATEQFIGALLRQVESSDMAERDATERKLRSIAMEWDRRAREARESGSRLRYERTKAEPGLFKRFGEAGEGFTVMDSMRNVDAGVVVVVREPGGV